MSFNFVDLTLMIKNNNWLDSNTRIVLISFSIYNGNFNHFAVVRLAVEFLLSGSYIFNVVAALSTIILGEIIPYVGEVAVVKALKYVTPYHHFLLALEIIVLMYFFVAFPLAEFREVC